MPTLTCDRTRELFSEALDRDLTPSIEQAFDRHLHACLRCEGEFARLRIAVGALQSCEPESVPDSFHATLAARVKTLDRQPLRRAAGLVAAAAAVTLLCFGWPWWQPGTAARHLP